MSGRDPQAEAVAHVIANVSPDILLLQGIDYDQHLAALAALRDRIAAQGLYYSHLFALPPNRGLATDVDLDGDGQRGAPGDAQGYGAFAGQDGLAILSRYPIDHARVRDFSALLWKDLPGAVLPQDEKGPFPSDAAQAVQRLSTTGHWDVPIQIGRKEMHLLAFHASPPVFDGPEDRNGLRNHDEIRFWQRYLDGDLGDAPDRRFLLLGSANLDPVDGDGHKSAITGLLKDRRVFDPAPRRPGPTLQGPGHLGDPRLDTVAWPEPNPGHLRVSYVLPSSDIRVIASGVHWPEEGTPALEIAQTASRHRLVWVDVQIE